MFYGSRLFGFSSSSLSLEDLEAQSTAADDSSSTRSSTSSRGPSPVPQYPLSLMPRALLRPQPSFEEPSRFAADRNFSEMQGLPLFGSSRKSYDSDTSSISSSVSTMSSSRSFSTCHYPIPAILLTPDAKSQIPFNYSPPHSPSPHHTRPPLRPTANRGEARPVDIDFIIQRALSNGAITRSVWFENETVVGCPSSAELLQCSSKSLSVGTTSVAP